MVFSSSNQWFNGFWELVFIKCVPQFVSAMPQLYLLDNLVSFIFHFYFHPTGMLCETIFPLWERFICLHKIMTPLGQYIFS